MATSTHSSYSSTIIQLYEFAPGQFTATQLQAKVHPVSVSPPKLAPPAGMPLSFQKDSLIVEGSWLPDTMTVSADITFGGSNLGVISGDLYAGVNLTVDLLKGTGGLSLYLKQACEVYLAYKLPGMAECIGICVGSLEGYGEEASAPGI